jgi:hypothetical protein
MAHTSIGRQVCDDSILAEDVVIGLEGELDVQLVSDIEGEVEVRVGVDAVIAGVDGGVVYFGEGGDGVANITAGLCYGGDDGSGKGAQSREAHGGAEVGGSSSIRWRMRRRCNQAKRRRAMISERVEGKYN